MTFLTRFEPYREFAHLERQMNRLLNEGPEGRDEAFLQTSFAPPVDIYEDEHSYTLKLEVPGIEEKDIDVKLENSTLTVSGERKFEKEEKEENYRRVERRYGSFVRSFTLPQTIDSDTVTAEYDKGLLKIRLAKKAEAKPKQIKISVGKQIEAAKGKAA
jgi:HSP20 family protein